MVYKAKISHDNKNRCQMKVNETDIISDIDIYLVQEITGKNKGKWSIGTRNWFELGRKYDNNYYKYENNKIGILTTGVLGEDYMITEQEPMENDKYAPFPFKKNSSETGFEGLSEEDPTNTKWSITHFLDSGADDLPDTSHKLTHLPWGETVGNPKNIYKPGIYKNLPFLAYADGLHNKIDDKTKIETCEAFRGTVKGEPSVITPAGVGSKPGIFCSTKCKNLICLERNKN